MGRYYTGDIDGKFWFGNQASDDAGFFGGEESEVRTLNYDFSKDDLPTIEAGIATCLEKLGDTKAKLDAYFSPEGEGYQGYNDQMLAKHLGIPKKELNPIITWYARLGLGEKILAKVKESGECHFEAET